MDHHPATTKSSSNRGMIWMKAFEDFSPLVIISSYFIIIRNNIINNHNQNENHHGVMCPEKFESERLCHQVNEYNCNTTKRTTFWIVLVGFLVCAIRDIDVAAVVKALSHDMCVLMYTDSRRFIVFAHLV